jgi:hypothetical protein
VTERPLEGAEVKLRRAREHLERLGTESADFLESDPYRVVVEFDSKSGWYLVKARIIEHAPIEMSVTVGEFAYECISALNHIVWQLAARKRGRRKIEGKQLREQIQFPVATSSERFLEKGLVKNGHVSKAALTVIGELQPYFRWNGEARAKSHSLWVLKELADADKHRVPAPRWGSLDLGNLSLAWDPNAAEPRSWPVPRRLRTLNDGACLQRVRFGVGNDIANVHVEGDPAPEITFGTADFLVGPRDLAAANFYMGRALGKLGALFP